jgi:hypothetical protein
MVIILENARFTERGRMWVDRLKMIAVELIKAIIISSPLGILAMLMFESRYVVSKVRMWEQRIYPLDSHCFILTNHPS